MKLNPKKCPLFQEEVKFLSHTGSANGIKTTGTKIRAIRDWPRPRDKREVRTFLGLCTYYRRVANGFADITALLHKLTDLKSQFNWTDESEAAFKRLKNAVCSSHILPYPQSSGIFDLDTDASNIGVGAYCHRCRTRKKKSSSTSAAYFRNPRRTTMLRGRGCWRLSRLLNTSSINIPMDANSCLELLCSTYIAPSDEESRITSG